MDSPVSTAPLDQAFAGIDWGMYKHEVCLLTSAGKRRTRSFDHNPDALAAMVTWLQHEAGEKSLAVAIETPHGPVVEALQAHGIAVYAINPKQADRFRDRHSVAGAKDDRLDAFVLADSLHTDLPKFTPVPPLDPLTLELRAVSRVYETHKDDFRAQANRLWQQLALFAPTLVPFCPAADEPWFWALCEQYLVHQRKPQRAFLVRLLTANRKRNVAVDELLQVLRRPLLDGPSGTAVRLQVEAVLPLLRLLHARQAAAFSRLKELLVKAGRNAEIIDSYTGIDVIITSVLLAEAPTAIQNADLQELRALSGIAPVTRRSGKSHHVVMRRSCNPRLRNAVRNWARSAITHDARAKDLYTAARARGCSFERALRGVADRLLACLAAALRDNTLYDPTRYKPRSAHQDS
jgi:transposase